MLQKNRLTEEERVGCAIAVLETISHDEEFMASKTRARMANKAIQIFEKYVEQLTSQRTGQTDVIHLAVATDIHAQVVKWMKELDRQRMG